MESQIPSPEREAMLKQALALTRDLHTIGMKCDTEVMDTARILFIKIKDILKQK